MSSTYLDVSVLYRPAFGQLVNIQVYVWEKKVFAILNNFLSHAWSEKVWQKVSCSLEFIITVCLLQLWDWIEIITSGSLGMIKGNRLPVEVRLSCLQIELQAPVLLLVHLFFISLAFLTPQGA